MIFLKKSLKPLTIVLISLLGLTLLVTILHYVNIINFKTTNILKLITPICAFIAGGFIMGRRSEKKGWLAGLKLGVIFICFLIIFNLIIKYKLTLTSLIYYSILLISSTFGGIIGINKNN